MKTLVVFIALALLSGCATYRTVHEVCSDPTEITHYKNYDQCYSEIKGMREAEASAPSHTQVCNKVFNTVVCN